VPDTFFGAEGISTTIMAQDAMIITRQLGDAKKVAERFP